MELENKKGGEAQFSCTQAHLIGPVYFVGVFLSVQVSVHFCNRKYVISLADLHSFGSISLRSSAVIVRVLVASFQFISCALTPLSQYIDVLRLPFSSIAAISCS